MIFNQLRTFFLLFHFCMKWKPMQFNELKFCKTNSNFSPTRMAQYTFQYFFLRCIDFFQKKNVTPKSGPCIDAGTLGLKLHNFLLHEVISMHYINWRIFDGSPIIKTLPHRFIYVALKSSIFINTPFFKHMGKLAWSSICVRFSQFEPEIMLDCMLNFNTHFMVWYCVWYEHRNGLF